MISEIQNKRYEVIPLKSSIDELRDKCSKAQEEVKTLSKVHKEHDIKLSCLKQERDSQSQELSKLSSENDEVCFLSYNPRSRKTRSFEHESNCLFL